MISNISYTKQYMDISNGRLVHSGAIVIHLSRIEELYDVYEIFYIYDNM